MAQTKIPNTSDLADLNNFEFCDRALEIVQKISQEKPESQNVESVISKLESIQEATAERKKKSNKQRQDEFTRYRLSFPGLHKDKFEDILKKTQKAITRLKNRL